MQNKQTNKQTKNRKVWKIFQVIFQLCQKDLEEIFFSVVVLLLIFTYIYD